MKVQKKSRKTRDQLLRMRTGHITIEDVASLFGISLHTARKYNEIGIVWNDDRDAGRLLFDVRIAKACYRQWRGHRADMTLKQISSRMREWVTQDLNGSGNDAAAATSDS